MTSYGNKIIVLLWLVLGLAFTVPAWAGDAGTANQPPRQSGSMGQISWVAPPKAPAAPTNADAPAVSSGSSSNASFESQPLSFQGDARRQSRPGADAAGQPRGTGISVFSLLPLLFFVLVFCGIFVGALYLAKKYLPGHRQLFSHPAMEVLGRTHLDQRRYVSLLRVGKRILVVGVSPDEMHPLSEITDEEEITGILEVARPKSEAGLNLFQRLFQRNVVDTEKAETRAMAQVKAEELAAQMSSLRERVQAIRESEESTRRVDALG